MDQDDLQLDECLICHSTRAECYLQDCITPGLQYCNICGSLWFDGKNYDLFWNTVTAAVYRKHGPIMLIDQFERLMHQRPFDGVVILSKMMHEFIWLFVNRMDWDIELRYALHKGLYCVAKELTELSFEKQIVHDMEVQ